VSYDSSELSAAYLPVRASGIGLKSSSWKVRDVRFLSTTAPEFSRLMSIFPALQICRGLGRFVKVLLIGDGDGGAVRELLKFPHVEHVTWVDIDSALVEACLEHLQLLPRSALLDERLSLVIADGRTFLSSAAAASFDVIIISVTEDIGQGPGGTLYRPELYRMVRAALVDDGVFARSLCALTPADWRPFNSYVQGIRKEFRRTMPYSIGLPAFGIDWAFSIAFPSQFRFCSWKYDGINPRVLTNRFFEQCLLRPTETIPRANNNS